MKKIISFKIQILKRFYHSKFTYNLNNFKFFIIFLKKFYELLIKYFIILFLKKNYFI